MNEIIVPENEVEQIATNNPKSELSVAELRDWLRNWIAKASGLPIEQISDDQQLDQFGLSSRDAVALSGDIEDLTGVQLTATIAYQNPTIALLAKRVIEGDPDERTEEDNLFYVRDPEVNSDTLDIAVIGLATRFPAGVSTPTQLWEALINKKDATSELPTGRWSEYLNNPELKALIAGIPTRGGYLNDIKSFDAEFFSMSPVEADYVDPQQRIALELTWEVFENAHLPISNYKGKMVGVFIGASNNDYSFIASLDPKIAHPYGLTGNSSSIISNRISYTFDFRGPAVTVDTACSSSLYAIHEAVRSLRTGEAELAVAGGVNLIATPIITSGFGKLETVLAPDGKIKAFSDDANGFNRAEGGGLVLLKRLDKAKQDGDDILAVIAGSAVNQDGHSNGLTAPNPVAQVEVLRSAYHDAGINPGEVDYVEAHGTGTLLGDPIEADALGQVLGRRREKNKKLFIGSAKTNFGHMESAAGVLGFIKTVLAIVHNKIAPQINFTTPNSYIPMQTYRLEVVTEPLDWPKYSGIKVAGVSGFGFGGTNAHVVLKEYLPPEINLPDNTKPLSSEGTPEKSEFLVSQSEQLIPFFLSAFLPSRLRLAATTLADWLESPLGVEADLLAVARTLSRRSVSRSRAVILARNREELLKGLRAVATKSNLPYVFVSDAPPVNPPVWVFSGYGSQHRKMAQQLYLNNKIFATALDEVDELIEFESGYSIVANILDDSQTYEVETAQVGIFAIQIALAALLKHHGSKPGALIGHSMGEVAESYISGGLSLADATQVICVRSRIMGEIEANVDPNDIRNMALVEYSATEIKEILTNFPDLEICVYAAYNQTVVGGPKSQIESLVARAETQGKFNRILATKGAGHTSQADMYLGDFSAGLLGIEPKGLQYGLFSSIEEANFFTAGSDPIHTIEYWVKGARHTVYFSQAISAALTAGYRNFVELSPNPVVLVSIAANQYSLGIQDAHLFYTLKRKENEIDSLTTALAQLFVFGDTVKPDTIFSKGEYAPIPPTPWVRKEHWVKLKNNIFASVTLPGQRVNLPSGEQVWQISVSQVNTITELLNSVAQLFPDSEIVASKSLGKIPLTGEITTIYTPNLTGGSISVYVNSGEKFTLLAQAVLQHVNIKASLDVVSPVKDVLEIVDLNDADAVSPSPVTEIEETNLSDKRWDPSCGVSVEEHLTKIVAESMGYEIDDVPKEIPLIELGLDSLMAMRIKNRVEFEFDIPELQLQAVRDASLNDVARYINYAVNNREKLAELADKNMNLSQKLSGNLTVAEIDKLLAAENISDITNSPSQENSAPDFKPNSIINNVTDISSVAVDYAVTDTGIPPRDAPERLAYATWAIVTGKTAGGIFNPLPVLDTNTAEKLAERLSKKTELNITVDEVLDAANIEELANLVRDYFEKATGMVRILHKNSVMTENSSIPIIVFHPAGGTTVTYEPLLKNLPKTTRMFGFERVEGSISERVEQYIPKLKEIQAEGPYVLAGWSLGGFLAYEMATKLKDLGEKVALVVLIDAVKPTQPFLDTPSERRKRIERYLDFGAKTYGVKDIPISIDKLAAADDEEQMRIITDLIKLNQNNIPSGVIEHQRTSYIDNRAIAQVEPKPYDGKVLLYRSNKMHSGAIELEPIYKDIDPDGGWAKVASDLEIVQIGGDHLAIIDEPYIAKIGADLTKRLQIINKLDR